MADVVTRCPPRPQAEIEDRYDALLKDLRDQLEHKASEMERMQSQMAPPRDLDMLRSQLQEELEGPHRAQLSKMEEDVEKCALQRRVPKGRALAATEPLTRRRQVSPTVLQRAPRARGVAHGIRALHRVAVPGEGVDLCGTP